MVFGSIADIFFQWETIGVFDFMLPFLLVFAVVFGVLSSTRFMGKNRPVYVIISVVVALMSLRYQYFLSSFLTELFPRLGIGIAIMLTIMILVGMFIAGNQRRYWGYGLASIGALIAIISFYQSAEDLGWLWLEGIGTDSVGFIVLGVLIIGVIIAVSVSGGSGSSNNADYEGPMLPGTGWGGTYKKE
jgi:hypothetical protein